MTLAFARAVHLYNAALAAIQPAPTFDDSPPSRSFFHRAVAAMLFDPKLIALVPHARLGTVSSIADLPVYALGLANAAYPLLYYAQIESEAAYLDAMRNFPLWRVNPCTTNARQTLDALVDRCLGILATSTGPADASSAGDTPQAACIDLTHLSRFERREGYADLGVRIFLDADIDGRARVVACDVPDDDCSSCGCSGGLVRRTDDLAIRRCTTALLTSATIEVHAAQIHLAMSDAICTLIHTHLPTRHAARRLLLPLTTRAFFANEAAVPFLLGPNGLCAWTNFTQRGVLGLVAHATSKLDPAWLLLGHEGERGSAAKHFALWRGCIRAHVRAFLALHPAIERDFASTSFVRAFASLFPRLRDPTLEDACTLALLVPVAHELFSNPWTSALVTNPFAASLVWREGQPEGASCNKGASLAEHMPTLAEQLRVNSTASSTMREATRVDSPEWIDRCCVTKRERAAYAAFVRSVGALDIPPDAVLFPCNVSSSVSY